VKSERPEGPSALARMLVAYVSGHARVKGRRSLKKPAAPCPSFLRPAADGCRSADMIRGGVTCDWEFWARW
jgi:hypothetical protein